MKIFSRQEAIANGIVRYFTGVPCKHGHTCERTVIGSTCVECNRAWQSKYYRENERHGNKTRARLAVLSKDRGPRYRRAKLNAREVLALKGARARATTKGLEFDLTLAWVAERRNFCEVSGLPFRPDYDGVHERNPFAPSIDRIDSSKGYTQNNCRVILGCLNMGIGEWGIDEVLPIWTAVVERRKAAQQQTEAP